MVRGENIIILPLIRRLFLTFRPFIDLLSAAAGAPHLEDFVSVKLQKSPPLLLSSFFLVVGGQAKSCRTAA